MFDKLKKRYAEQDNACTAYPIYIAVQELQFVAVGDPDYGGAGDTESKYEFTHPLYDDGGTFQSRADVRSYLQEYHDLHGDELEKEMKRTNQLFCIYRWTDVEYFLTHEGADEYLAANQHNLGETRHYVKHFSRRNFEMRELLSELGFRVKD